MTGTPDSRLRAARIATLATLGMGVAVSLVMPALGALREPRPLWIALGLAAIAAFAAAQAGVLYAAVTPSLGQATHRRLVAAFAAASVLTVPLAAPLGGAAWQTWAWIGASIIGTAPLLAGRALTLAVIPATVLVSYGTAAWSGASPLRAVLITVTVGLSFVALGGLHVWLWQLLLEAREGRDAQARLAAAEERLRFARDVHDLLGHDLSVIALKAELVERLPPEQARAEAADLRRLAAETLTHLRQAIDGYRRTDLRAELASVERVLRASGVRCTVSAPDGELPQQLAPMLREASTNILRHSAASWCRIEVTPRGMTVANDGAGAGEPDPHSSGLRGLADRLAEHGGTLRTRVDGDVFTLEVAL
ncbi:sensor histidine kinase [Thermoactinospora rubra]|uniref:sensor histidine kinase n=1 Tax=Thermoactinospora rubra TaxID=1088767 RepID=UPI000A1155EF|nr:histidine kinase [Thermoactinospora rubra]